jgi:hypothetical protein
MMKQIELMLREFLIADAKTAQGAKASVDAVNGAGLGGE